MRIIKLLQRESGYFALIFTLLGLVSGILNALLIPFINHVISLYQSEQVKGYPVNEILLFIGLIVASIIAQRFFSQYLINLTQKLVFRIRLEIIDKVRKANFMAFERIGKEAIYASITRDATIISNNAAQIVYTTTSIITIVFLLFYLLYLSWIGFAATLSIMILGIAIYYIRQKPISVDLKKARNLETTFFKYNEELLSGFKEVKIDQDKNDDIFHNYITKISEEAKNLTSRSMIKYLDNSLMSHLSLLVLIGFILLIVPQWTGEKDHIFEYIFIILYIIGPISGVTTVIPGIAQAGVSIDKIEEIDRIASEIIERQEAYNHQSFESLELKNVVFKYDAKNDDSFSIGPIDLKIENESFVFISGGNGSGKTTFFKVLTGLYQPVSGDIYLNGNKVENYAEFRSIFSPIYSDFHLFKKFYGRQNVSSEKVNHYLKLMELDAKVTFNDNGFSQISLSTGQRKRLALIVSLMEDRPVLVLDEWAADQDPLFRKFFYTTILPDLKKSGKTIIAITHDDHYFHVADTLYKMEYGKLNTVDK